MLERLPAKVHFGRRLHLANFLSSGLGDSALQVPKRYGLGGSALKPLVGFGCRQVRYHRVDRSPEIHAHGPTKLYGTPPSNSAGQSRASANAGKTSDNKNLGNTVYQKTRSKQNT